jgi:four helix bundle protein
MSGNLVQEKSFEFALKIIDLFTRLRDQHEYVMSEQLLRCGTSIGANVEEALGGQSRADFVSKLSIARKEARETHYWLRLIQASRLTSLDVSPEITQVGFLLRLLTSIIKTTKENPASEQNS